MLIPEPETGASNVRDGGGPPNHATLPFCQHRTITELEILPLEGVLTNPGLPRGPCHHERSEVISVIYQEMARHPLGVRDERESVLSSANLETKRVLDIPGSSS